MPDYEIAITEPGHTIKATTTQSSLAFDDAILREIVGTAKTLHSHCALKRVDLEYVSPHVYTYKWKAADGRIWKQTLTCDQPGNPLMTFETNAAWRSAEFEYHRPVRAAVIKAIETLGLKTFEMAWVA